MKWKRLSRGKQLSNRKNYQGQEVELCCEGGEVGFVLRLVEESARQRFRLACLWFSSLLSRQSSMRPIHQRLGELGAKRRRFEICQGRNVKWVIAWSFYPKTERGMQLLQMLEVARGDASEANEAREGTEETESAVPEMPVPRKRSAQPRRRGGARQAPHAPRETKGHVS